MAIEEVISLKVDGGDSAAKSVKSLKQEIREAQAEAIQLSREFGDFHPEAQKAAKRVAELKDEMGDFQQRVAGLNPDKFQAIAGVVQGVAGGIAAAQGAMALFGAESEETAKTLAKVQGAIAFSQGVQQILDLRNSFGAMASVIKTQVVTAFSTLKGAIAATGIGVLIIAIGVAIEKFNELGEASEKAAQDIEKSLKFIEDVTKLNELDLRKDIAAAKLRGASEDELDKIRARNYQRRVELIQDERAKATDKSKFDLLLKEEAVKAEEFITSVKLRQYSEQKAARDKYFADAKAAQEKAYQDEIEAEKQFQAAMDELRQIEEDREKTAAETLTQIQNELKTNRMSDMDKQLFELRQWYDKQKQILIEGGTGADGLLALENLYWDKKEALNVEQQAKDFDAFKTNEENKVKAKEEANKKQADLDNQRLQAEKQAHDIAYQQTSSALGSISQLLGQATAAGKAAAIIQVGVDEAKALSGALANSQSPTPDNIATGGIAGIAKYATIAASLLAGFVRIKNILGATGNTVSVSTNGVQPIPINSGALPSSDNQIGYSSNRVYVLEGDITKTQRRVRNNRGVSVI